MTAPWFSVLIALSASVDAHDTTSVERVVDAYAWNTQWPLVAGLALAAVLYGIGYRRYARTGAPEARRRWRSAAWWIGWSALAVAILSPLDALGSHLFAAHMAQHELMMLVAAPLIVAGRPLSMFAWAVPRLWTTPFAALGEPRLEVLLDATMAHALVRAARPVPRGCALQGPALALHACPLLTWRKDIEPIVKAKCGACHGVSTPIYEERILDRKNCEAKNIGPRMDNYVDFMRHVVWPATGSMMRRADDGKNAGGKPGNMHAFLGATDDERARNLATLKTWLGEGARNLNRWDARDKVPGFTKEQLDRVKAYY